MLQALRALVHSHRRDVLTLVLLLIVGSGLFVPMMHHWRISGDYTVHNNLAYSLTENVGEFFPQYAAFPLSCADSRILFVNSRRRYLCSGCTGDGTRLSRTDADYLLANPPRQSITGYALCADIIGTVDARSDADCAY